MFQWEDWQTYGYHLTWKYRVKSWFRRVFLPEPLITLDLEARLMERIYDRMNSITLECLGSGGLANNFYARDAWTIKLEGYDVNGGEFLQELMTYEEENPGEEEHWAGYYDD